VAQTDIPDPLPILLDIRVTPDGTGGFANLLATHPIFLPLVP